MGRPSVSALLKLGHQRLREKHAAKERDKLGTLRGGNTGALIAGQFYGKCPRRSLIRMSGFDPPSSNERELMFAAGRTNEDSWDEVLRGAWTEEDGTLLREEQIPVAWETRNGTKVTGRPDFVLADRDGKLLVGLELKLVSAFWTMIGVFMGKKPKTDHLLQAAHYSMALTIPFELWYTSRVDWPVFGWVITKFFGKVVRTWQSWWGESHYDFREDGSPKKVLPFYQGYELQWGDTLLYRVAGTENWERTRLTKQSIVDYYEYVSRMGETKVLGPRPVDVGIDQAQTPEPYSQCDYCPLQKVCDQHEHNYSEWFDAASKLSKT